MTPQRIFLTQTRKKNMNKYIASDCSGSALQFTGSGRSIQCSRKEADRFETEEEAKAALKSAEETGGSILTDSATTTDGKNESAVFGEGEK